MGITEDFTEHKLRLNEALQKELRAFDACIQKGRLTVMWLKATVVFLANL